jgi:hypothetical protein
MSGGAGPQEPIDVKDAECEYERVNGTEDDERDRRRARSQEGRHSFCCS